MKINKTTIAILPLFICLGINAENQGFKHDQGAARISQIKEARNQEFYEYLNNYLDEYEAWRDEYTRQVDTEKAELIDQWGIGLLSDKSVEVEYSQDNTVRTLVDYESNTATVSVIVGENETKMDALARFGKNSIVVDEDTLEIDPDNATTETNLYSVENEHKEKQFIMKQTQAQMNEVDVRAERLMRTPIGVPDIFIHQRAEDQKAELLKQAQLRVDAIEKLYSEMRSQQSSVTSPETSNSLAVKKEPTLMVFTEETVEQTESMATKKAGKKVVNFKIRLPEDALKARAELFKPLAEKESQIWKVDPALIMAIMHSESSFKPSARSHVPAYGLMQIVPSTAGHDVNKRVRNIDAPMKSKELYIPEINVETGTAYLNILNSRYLRRVHDDKSRLYCVIAAYNTGVGNVAKAFNKNRSSSIRSAAKIINRMSSEQVYNQLMNNLPYNETKKYLKKVNNRMSLY